MELALLSMQMLEIKNSVGGQQHRECCVYKKCTHEWSTKLSARPLRIMERTFLTINMENIRVALLFPLRFGLFIWGRLLLFRAVLPVRKSCKSSRTC